jgi:amino acid transporter
VFFTPLPLDRWRSASVLGILAAVLITVGNAGGVGSTVAGIARVPFVVGIDRYLPAAFDKIHSRWKTPYISILVQAIVSGAILLGSQINETTRGAYQFLIGAAIILYFIPFLYMFAAVIKLAHRKDRKENSRANLVRGGITGVWISGGLGFLVVLVGIAVSLVPPGDSADKLEFELKLVAGTAESVISSARPHSLLAWRTREAQWSVNRRCLRTYTAHRLTQAASAL